MADYFSIGGNTVTRSSQVVSPSAPAPTPAPARGHFQSAISPAAAGPPAGTVPATTLSGAPRNSGIRRRSPPQAAEAPGASIAVQAVVAISAGATGPGRRPRPTAAACGAVVARGPPRAQGSADPRRSWAASATVIAPRATATPTAETTVAVAFTAWWAKALCGAPNPVTPSGRATTRAARSTPAGPAPASKVRPPPVASASAAARASLASTTTITTGPGAGAARPRPPTAVAGGSTVALRPRVATGGGVGTGTGRRRPTRATSTPAATPSRGAAAPASVSIISEATLAPSRLGGAGDPSPAPGPTAATPPARSDSR